METIPIPIVNKMVDVITTISSQSKDNPELVNSIFGFAVVRACNEIEEELIINKKTIENVKN